MKTAGILFLSLILITLCVSCGKAESVSSLCVYKEYDMEVDLTNMDKQLETIYPQSEYMVSKQNDGYYMILPNDEKRLEENGTLFVEVLSSASEAHDIYIATFLGIDTYYRYGVIRLNHMVVYGQSDILKPFMAYFSMDIPDEKQIRSGSVIKKYNREIDLEKFSEVAKEHNYSIYQDSNFYTHYQDSDLYTQSTHYIVINDDGTSLAGLYAVSEPEAFFDMMLSTGDFTAGRLIVYQNVSFITLDDFWLDIIKQCEKS